jgi:hypothetical protein
MAVPDGDDDTLRARVEEWFSFVTPNFPDPQRAKASLVESAFTAVKHRLGCLNPKGSWQEVSCPHQLTLAREIRSPTFQPDHKVTVLVLRWQ